MLILTVIAAYLSAIAFFYLFQRQMLFQPAGTLVLPMERGFQDIEAVKFRSADATELTGWYREAEPGLPTVLYFHGNGGNISDRADRFRRILASGFGLLAVSYRGYAGSGGSPSEAALFTDALEIFDWLSARTGSIVIHGESLGTGIATYVTAHRPAGALVLEAPFTAAVDIAAAIYPWVPVRLLMRDQFLSREHIRRVGAPILIAHGTDDIIVPVAHGQRLFEVANEPKRIVVFEDAGHLDLWDRGLWRIVLEFLEENSVVAQAAA